MYSKTKRIVETAAFAVAPYLAWSFVSFDWSAAFATQDARFFWLMLTVFVTAGAYTFPRLGE
ncbi:hypothetical protein HAAEEKHM_00036 [Sinorhizobium phage AP-16-3]|nr:hypothetical protein HAAEEKHM_00036 [Sinorhizobium phage AP-16-3]